MNICVIPARGGSKRIPRKNIRDFAGRPMIAWPIQAALDAGCFARVVVSTEDAEIARTARAAGAEALDRPAEIADDYATTLDVMRHAAGALPGAEVLCCLYATAAFTTPGDLLAGKKALEDDPDADYAFSVAPYPHPVQRALRLTHGGRVAPCHPEHTTTRTQDLEPLYHDAGAFYWGRAAAWATQKPVHGPGSIALPLPPHRVCDIDTEEDWARAEALFKALRAS
ncbi:MAG TPA: pseudaminic acid cytidylyltransferase [Rhodospirillaceae bacterium]|jgi:pseudaminic acid cytidylyltransferase|nr:pseudaminic acid cytidylyltransferase [Alphaproteobacteria bacterium]HBH25822.1 pseudaminic acid cytidylyltransferase [Rhodospirillaceae bacterium]